MAPIVSPLPGSEAAINTPPPVFRSSCQYSAGVSQGRRPLSYRKFTLFAGGHHFRTGGPVIYISFSFPFFNPPPFFAYFFFTLRVICIGLILPQRRLLHGEYPFPPPDLYIHRMLSLSRLKDFF